MSERIFEVYEGKHRGLIKAWTSGVPFEEGAKDQVRNMASMPFIHKWVAVMPDVHRGLGATVGSVIPTRGAVIPAAVGTDIGCGMLAVKTTLTANDLPDNVDKILQAIEAAVPCGRTDDGGPNDRGAWRYLPPVAQGAWDILKRGYSDIVEKYPKINRGNTENHLGTLGTGNHFIEMCIDEENSVWFMLHSGSRGVGHRIGTFFIDLAKKDMQRWFVHLPDEDLSYFPEGTEHFDDYVEAVSWAQRFASVNRALIMEATIDAVRRTGLQFDAKTIAIDCHHNYVEREHHYGENVLVTRKGAVRARIGDLGIIPGSMGTSSYIVRGLGNPESFHSCSHGAGRVMSRAEAKRRFSVEDHILATEGIACRKDEGVIDETPGAYKPIDLVMIAQRDLVEVVHKLRQVLCVKG